jgi:hypothetical protein
VLLLRTTISPLACWCFVWSMSPKSRNHLATISPGYAIAEANQYKTFDTVGGSDGAKRPGPTSHRKHSSHQIESSSSLGYFLIQYALSMITTWATLR